MTADASTSPTSDTQGAVDHDRDQPVQAGQMDESRRRYLKYLIALAIGVPLALEAGTFLGLLQGQVGNDEGLAVGDDVLPQTDRAETVETLSVGDGTFDLEITVENTETAAYGLRISEVRFSNGDARPGDTAVGPVASGERAQLTGSWSIPADAEPTALVVTGLEYVDGSERVVASDVVELSTAN